MFYAYRVIEGAWVVFVAVWVVAAFTTKRTIRRQSFGSRFMQIVLGLTACYFLVESQWKAVLDRQVIPRTMFIEALAASMTVAGILFAIWARFVLGRNWSGMVTLKEDHELIRTGPYRVVRHPIYSGILFALLGSTLARGDIGSLFGLVLAAITLRLKSLTEESLMMRQFTSQYANYKSEVKALIPFVW